VTAWYGQATCDTLFEFQWRWPLTRTEHISGSIDSDVADTVWLHMLHASAVRVHTGPEPPAHWAVPLRWFKLSWTHQSSTKHSAVGQDLQVTDQSLLSFDHRVDTMQIANTIPWSALCQTLTKLCIEQRGRVSWPTARRAPFSAHGMQSHRDQCAARPICALWHHTVGV
jgi:hypothetical protein